MSDHKEAYASRTFKRDKYAWAFLILFVLVFFLTTGGWRETDRIIFRSWEEPVSNQATLTVLEFDRVVWKENEGHVHQDQLRKQLNALAEDGFEAVSIRDVFNFYYKGDKLPEKSILLIFANGYLETYSVVDPVLKQMHWPAVVSLITDPIVRRETFFLYWDRLRQMVDSGIWDIIAGGHFSPKGMTNASKLMDGFYTRKVGITKDEREAIDRENSASILQDYKVSHDLIEENISGYKTLAHSHRYLKNANLGYLSSAPLKQLFKLGFVDSFVGVNREKSDPYRLRRLRVQPGWQPETLLAVTNKAIHATAISEQRATEEDSAWFTSEGELVETSGHSNILSSKKLSVVRNQSVDPETYLHGFPGTSIFLPGGNSADNWILDVNFRLNRGEFWIRQNSIEQGEEWRLGGNENNLNLQYRVAHGKYENLASSRAGFPLEVWQHVRLIRRGQGVIVNLNGERLWNLPVHLRSALKGDIALQVWSGDGEGALKLKNAKVSFFPHDIRWLEEYPQEMDVQRLIQDAERVSGVTTVTHVIQGDRLQSVPYDKDLFQIIAHRYSWDFIPTVSLLSEKKTSKHEDASFGYLWMSEIQTLVKQNQWTHVHLDLSKQTTEMKPEGSVRFSELKAELENMDCQLLVTARGRSDIGQSIEDSTETLSSDRLSTL
ncbi:MAG: polysaccharide deacetylase family protein [Nitrospinae bacterium]|nr:polysaccharide deacetylase family protein [Nitrospinota bacterium]MDA1109445.1 polysaccharide deacetylase family protein [Nitrospinota bacterium]